MITSTKNPLVKFLAKLNSDAGCREREKKYLAEGKNLVAEALRDIPEQIEKIFIVPEITGRSHSQNIFKICQQKKIACEEITALVFKKITDTETPQGILALLKKTEIAGPYRARNNFFLILENLQDPGNLGTILRTAEAAGVGKVIISQTTVDPYNPKAVRSSMGSIFRVPVIKVNDFKKTIEDIKKQGGQVLAASSKKGRQYDKMNFKFPLALILGQEAQGISGQVEALATEIINIPLAGGVESLNVASAAAILLFEIKKSFSND